MPVEEAREYDVVDLPTSDLPGGPRHEASPVAEEEIAAGERFDWASTAALPERGPAGLPAVYYALVRVESLQQARLVELLQSPWDIRPLFASERGHEPSEPQLLSGAGAGAGWAYILVGGAVYNRMRDEALAGRSMFPAVILRAPPPDIAVHPDGSIMLEPLFRSGFPWQPRPLETGELGTAQEALTEAFAATARAILEVAEGVARVIQDFLAVIFGATSDLATVTIPLTITTVDADYVPAGAPMLRSWGPSRGLPIANNGQEVMLQRVSSPGGTWRARLGPSNVATFSVPDDSTYRFCVMNALNGGKVIDFWFTTQSCTGTFTIDDGVVAATQPALLGNHDLQAITLANDGVLFIRSTQAFGGVRVPIIASGNHGQALAATGNGYVPGLGGLTPAELTASMILDATVLAAATVGFPAAGLPAGVPFLGVGPGTSLATIGFIRTLMNVDIVWPPVGDIGPGTNSSRLVFVHELGHHILFQLIATRSPNPLAYGVHLNTLFLGAIAEGIGPITAGMPWFEPMAVNEGFADVIAEQLAGGGNRIGFLVPGTYPGDRDGGDERYCNPAIPMGCFEHNIAGTFFADLPLFAPGNRQFINLAAMRLATTLHDLTDDSVGDFSHNGHVWVRLLSGPTVPCPVSIASCPAADALVPVPDPSAGLVEETIAQPFVTLLVGIQLWLLDPAEALVMNTDSVMHGMTRSLRGAGETNAAICAMYALHTPGGGCPTLWMLP